MAFLGLVIAYLLGTLDKSKLKMYSMVAVITTLILIGMLIIVAIVIFNSLCAIF